MENDKYICHCCDKHFEYAELSYTCKCYGVTRKGVCKNCPGLINFYVPNGHVLVETTQLRFPGEEIYLDSLKGFLLNDHGSNALTKESQYDFCAWIHQEQLQCSISFLFQPESDTIGHIAMTFHSLSRLNQLNLRIGTAYYDNVAFTTRQNCIEVLLLSISTNHINVAKNQIEIFLHFDEKYPTPPFISFTFLCLNWKESILQKMVQHNTSMIDVRAFSN